MLSFLSKTITTLYGFRLNERPHYPSRCDIRCGANKLYFKGNRNMTCIASVDVPTALYSETMSACKAHREEIKKVSVRRSPDKPEKCSDSKVDILAALELCSRAPLSARPSLRTVPGSKRSPRVLSSTVNLSTFRKSHTRSQTPCRKHLGAIDHRQATKKRLMLIKPDFAVVDPVAPVGKQRDSKTTERKSRQFNGTCICLPKGACFTFLDFSQKCLRTLPCLHSSNKSSCHGGGLSYAVRGKVSLLESVEVLHLSRNKIVRLGNMEAEVAKGENESAAEDRCILSVAKPIHLAAFKRVVLLDVSHNDLTGLEGVECMISLRELQASHNRITNLYPLFAPHSTLGTPQGLQSLDASYNAITTIMPPDVKDIECESADGVRPQLLALRNLTVCCNFLTELHNISCVFPNLQKLRAIRNSITEMPSLPEGLHYICLQKNYLSKAEVRRGMELRGQLPHLKLMNLDDQRVLGTHKRGVDTAGASESGEVVRQLVPIKGENGEVVREVKDETAERKHLGDVLGKEERGNGSAAVSRTSKELELGCSVNSGAQPFQVSYEVTNDGKVEVGGSKHSGTVSGVVVGKPERKERGKRTTVTRGGGEKLREPVKVSNFHVDPVDEDIVALVRTRAQRKEFDISKALNRDVGLKKTVSVRGADGSRLTARTGLVDRRKSRDMRDIDCTLPATLKVLEAKLVREQSETTEVEGSAVISGAVAGYCLPTRSTPRVSGAFGWNWLASELQPPLRLGELQRCGFEDHHDDCLCLVSCTAVTGEAIKE